MNTYHSRLVIHDASLTLLLIAADCQNWLSRRCERIRRSRGTAGILLSGTGPKSFGVLIDCAAFQDQADMKDRREE